MTTNQYFTIIVSFITDFMVTAGSTLAGGALGNGQIPSKSVWALAAVTGMVAAARRVQALLATPPTVTPPTTGAHP